MKSNFERLFINFNKELNFYIRNSWSELKEEMGSNIQKYQSGEFDIAVHKIVEIRGKYLQKIGDKTIKLFKKNLKLFRSKPIKKSEITQICESIKSKLNGLCSDCRSNLKAYAASKGKENFYGSWDMYWIREELELRVDTIEEKLRLEIQKYNCHPYDLHFFDL